MPYTKSGNWYVLVLSHGRALQTRRRSPLWTLQIWSRTSRSIWDAVGWCVQQQPINCSEWRKKFFQWPLFASTFLFPSFFRTLGFCSFRRWVIAPNNLKTVEGPKNDDYVYIGAVRIKQCLKRFTADMVPWRKDLSKCGGKLLSFAAILNERHSLL